MKNEAKGGYSYFITFTNDMSRYGYLYLMKHKSESFEMFKRFHSEVKKKLKRVSRCLVPIGVENILVLILLAI